MAVDLNSTETQDVVVTNTWQKIANAGQGYLFDNPNKVTLLVRRTDTDISGDTTSLGHELDEYSQLKETILDTTNAIWIRTKGKDITAKIALTLG